jgi:hypothetical protein
MEKKRKIRSGYGAGVGVGRGGGEKDSKASFVGKYLPPDPPLRLIARAYAAAYRWIKIKNCYRRSADPGTPHAQTTMLRDEQMRA